MACKQVCTPCEQPCRCLGDSGLLTHIGVGTLQIPGSQQRGTSKPKDDGPEIDEVEQ